VERAERAVARVIERQRRRTRQAHILGMVALVTAVVTVLSQLAWHLQQLAPR
jgi:hypothetical protein